MENELISRLKTKLRLLTESYSLAKTDNDTASNEARELSFRGEGLDKCSNDC